MPDTFTPPTPSTDPKNNAADPAARLAAIIKDNDDKLAQGFREIREEEARRMNELRSREPAPLKETAGTAPASPVRPAFQSTRKPAAPAPVTDTRDKEVLSEYYKKNSAEIERARKILAELEAKKPGTAKAFISGTPTPTAAAPFDRAAAEARIQEKVRAIEEKGRIEMAEAARATELKKKEINDRARADIARINKAEQERVAAIRTNTPKAEPKVVVAAPATPAAPTTSVSSVAAGSTAATMATLAGSFGVLRSLRSERDMLAGNQKGSKKTEVLQTLWKKEMRSTRERLAALEKEIGLIANPEERSRLTRQLQEAQQQFSQALSGADTAPARQVEPASKPSVMIDVKPLVAGASISALGLLRVNADSSLKDIRAELEYTKRGMQPLQQAFAEYAAQFSGPQVDANGNVLDDKTYQAFQDELGPLSRRVSALENLQRNRVERLMSAHPSELSPAELKEARLVAKEQLAAAINAYNAYGRPKEWTLDKYGNKQSVDSVDLELKAQVERLTKRSELLSGVGASVAVAGAVAAAVTQNVTTSAAVDSLSSATASFASSVTGSMQSSKPSVTGTLTETRAKLEAVRSQLVALNARMDSYDRANPGRQDSSQAQAMEAEYAPLYDKFQKLQEVERAQSADPTQMDGSGSLEEVSAAQQQIELQMRALNQEADSSVLMNAPDDSPRKQAVNEQLDYLNSEYQRLDGLRRQKEEQRDLADASSKFDDSGQAAKNGKAGASPNPSKIAPIGAGSPAGNTPSASLAGDDAPPFNYASGPAAGDSGPVTTRGGDAVNASVDASTGKIDFIDITIYTSFALGVDAVGLIPVVGEVTSPLGILGFRLLFWLKGMGAKNMNWLMALTGVTEVIPVASEILPGCTAFVLAACLTQVLEDKVAQSVQAATQSSSATKLPLPQTTATLVAESTEDASNTQTSGAPSSSAQMSFSDSGSASPSDSLAGNNDIAAAISLDGAGGRFPSGNPTSPGRAPTDPEGATKG